MYTFEANKKVQLNQPTSILVLFGVVAVALLFRRYDAFAYPQLWAEDGTVFLQQYEAFGIKSLFIPYAGYLLILPRLIALIGGFSIPLIHIPVWYNFNAFLFIFFTSYSLWRSATILNLKNKIAYATFFLFLPIGGEMFMNITNVIWFNALFLINFIVIGHRHGNIYINTLLVILFGLTGPFSLLISPLVLLILFIERKELKLQKALPLLLILVCGIIQFILIKQSGSISRGGGGTPEQLHLVRLIVNNTSDILLLSSTTLSELSPLKFGMLCIIVFLFFMYAVLQAYVKLDQARKYILIIAPVLFLGSFIMAFWPNESSVTSFVCPRYYFVPFACIAMIFIVAYDDKIKTQHLAILLFFFLLHSKREVSNLPDKHWKEEISDYNQGKRQDVDINPEGWKIILPAKK